MHAQETLQFSVVSASLALFSFAAAQQVSASTVTITTSQDTTIFANTPAASDGGAPVMFSGTDNSRNIKRALAEFNLVGSVPTGSTITGVQLTLSLEQVAGNQTTGTATIDLHALSDSWGEGTNNNAVAGMGIAANTGDATYSDRFYSSTSPTAWNSTGGDFASTISASLTVGTALVGYTWQSTPQLVADVQGWLNNPSSNNGWFLQNENETGQQTYRAFYTREESTASLQPQLVITFTPEPTAGLLPVFGMVGLAMRRRRVI